jgi:hypothetical protein
MIDRYLEVFDDLVATRAEFDAPARAENAETAPAGTEGVD